MDSLSSFTDVFKIVLIGDANVGKTALTYRYVLNEIPEGLQSTIGVEFTKKEILHIWDTAGQEKFRSITKHHYRGADACLIIFDVLDRLSFKNLDNWLQELKENTPNVVTCLIANKMDKEFQRVVTRQEGMAFASANSLMYRETSAMWERDYQDQDRIITGISGIYDSIVELIASKSISKKQQQLNETGKVSILKLTAAQSQLQNKEDQNKSKDCNC